VAFHEPGVDRSLFSGCVRLSDVTRSYLDLEPGTWGLTYGASAFLKCRKILVLARGDKKKLILEQSQFDSSIPIGWIMKHPDVTLISDFEFSQSDSLRTA
jgi:6-phosphogluconolactonase/glucosamine-6-phosphate isomerase/deaminase